MIYHISYMGILSKFMGYPLFFFVWSLLLIPASPHLQSSEEGHVFVLLTDKGIDFVKDVLIEKALSSMIPLQLSSIEKSKKIPLIGKVHLTASNITIYSASLSSSHVETGEAGLLLVASGGTAQLSMRWEYSYKNWLFVVSDSGNASVQVEGMEVGLAVALKEQEGTIKLSVLGCGCDVKDISIKVDGGVSWLYQGLVDAFEKPIGSAVEAAICKRIKEGMVKLDSRLQSLPKQIPLGHVAALNVTFVDDPVLSNSSVELIINGLLTAADNVVAPDYYYKGAQPSVSGNSPPQMIKISINEDVLNSATLVYFNADYMHWEVDKFVDQSLLNTAAWKHVYPQLYKEYPDDDMSLKISVTSSPVIHIVEHGINGTIYLDVAVNVLDAGEVIPVGCLSLVINASCSPQILEDKLTGILKLQHFMVSLKWSKMGNVNMNLLQSALLDVSETTLIPYVNSRLTRGFRLPHLGGFSLRNAEIHCTESKILVSGNLAYT